MSPIIAQNLGKGDKSHSFNLTLKATDRGTPAKSDEEVSEEKSGLTELELRISRTEKRFKIGLVEGK